MSEQHQRVEPTPFSALEPSESSADSAPPVVSSRWFLPALAVLALLTLAVVFLLPKWVAAPATAPPEQAQTAASDSPLPAAATRTTEKPAPGDSPSPFADAVEAKARAQAQDLLAELLDVQENLEARGAQSWAPEAVAAVASEALAGDQRYRDREFEAAISHYTSALEQALALEASLPARFEEQMLATQVAVEALDREAANAAFDLAELLEPDSGALAELAGRLAALPAVSAAVETARSAEAARDLASAVTALQEAQSLDPSHQYVQSELSRVGAALNTERFSAAMSEGYAALAADDFKRARRDFDRAGKLRGEGAEVAAALQELAVARTAATLRALRRRGDALLAAEDWAAAIPVFEEALSVDGSLRFAREGLATARPRAVLDAELTAIIEGSERLVDDAVLREARGSLSQAQSFADIGPGLSAQIAQVTEILSIASEPLSVNLRSDAATEVTVYKVARLGMFAETQLSLRPGQYTAVGTRRGYRDVRVVFSVSPGRRATVVVACTEPI
ncbi:MAG: tetratricopeptide (TPR) repeat protein [Halieaceae bacterium]|jgi:tetratricopeptide (TPR) repeat protein